MGSLKMASQPFSSNNMFSGTHTNAQTTAIAGGLSGTNRYISPLKFVNWAQHRFQGLGDTSATPGNGDGVTFSAYATDNLKTFLAYPTEVKTTVSTGGDTFDLTSITFDTTNTTFDEN